MSTVKSSDSSVLDNYIMTLYRLRKSIRSRWFAR